MNSAKSTLIFLASFIVVGLLVILIDQMYPTAPISKKDFQLSISNNLISEMEK